MILFYIIDFEIESVYLGINQQSSEKIVDSIEIGVLISFLFVSLGTY